MKKMIRHEKEKPESKTHWLGLVWIGMFAILAIATACLAIWQGQKWGLPALILLVGATIVSIIALLTIIIQRKHINMSSAEFDAHSQMLTAGFMALSQPSLIMQNGQAKMANVPYMDLACELGVSISLEGEPPHIDRLFAKTDTEQSAAIFRLHQTSKGAGNREETIRILTENGLKAFRVCVKDIDKGQLWQIIVPDEHVVSNMSLLGEAPIGLFSIKGSGDVLEINGALRKWLGFEDEQIPENMAAFIENPEILLDSIKTPGRVVRSDTRLITAKGVVSPTVMCGIWQTMESGDVYASVAVYGHSGLGARMEKTQAQLAEGKNNTFTQGNFAGKVRLDVLGDAPFGVFQLDSDVLLQANILDGNAAFAKMIGQDIAQKSYVPLLFKDIFVHTDDLDAFLEKGVALDASLVDLQLVGEKNCQVNVYFSNNSEGGYLAYMVDISKRKELEDRLMQSQKLQAIGQLAGGVAHDFNNLLTVIRLNTDELLGRHPIGDPSYPELQQINQTVARSADLVRKLLAFSRKQTMRVETLDVTDVLSDLSIMLKRVMVERVQLDVVHGRDLPPILADKSQFDTVFMNLCVNARDAMVEVGKPGTITLTSTLATSENYKQDDITAPDDGGFVIIAVADTGTGMSAETQKKIFEPFFTTKEQGKGTGLGLATVYGIVEQSGGHLRVESTLGKGTCFRVYIPIGTRDAVAQAPKKRAPEHVKPANLAGQGKILFVEDEDAVRAIAAKTLRKRGYTVIEACDGEEAFEILEEGGDVFDLMISDVMMPGMDGPTLLKKGRSLLGDAQIVFISGYAQEEFSDLLGEEPDVTFLPKPFTLVQLAEKVKSVIGEAN